MVRNEPIPSLNYLYEVSHLFFDANTKDDRSEGRHHSNRKVVDARKIYCWLARYFYPNKTQNEIMKLIGRNRSMMNYYVDQARYHMKYDHKYKQVSNKIFELLKIDNQCLNR